MGQRLEGTVFEGGDKGQVLREGQGRFLREGAPFLWHKYCNSFINGGGILHELMAKIE
jgi:hypothetical protein